MSEIKGIDVSANQGNINWKTVANYGMGFAILRITEKGNVIDPTFEKNYKGCIDNKIPVGVYKYSYATSIEQIKTEVSIVIKTLNKRKLDYPVFLDIEDKCQRNISKNIMMQMINAFRAIIVKAGYKFGIYCSESWYNTYLPDGAKKYDCWIAHYPDPDDGTMQTRVKPGTGIGWQYSSKATIPGIPTKVDRSIFYKDYSSINNANKQEGGNKLTKEQAINALIAVAKNEIGYLEKATNAQLDSKTANAGYNNYTKYWRDVYPAYQGQPWCACQISWDMMTAFGLETAKKLLRHWPYVYCPAMRDYFTLYANPQVGDIVIFWSSKKKEFVHTGLVIKVQGDQFWTIEGNTSGASGIVANGGGVCQKSYYNSQLPGTKFCRPDYSIVTSIKSNSSTNTSTTTATKNWIEYGDRGNDVKNLQAKLNKVGHNLEVDGICGNATVSAIKDFQEKYNLTVDGQAGKNTITKLDSVIAAKENKNFKAFVGACTTNSTPVYQKATGATALATYPILNRGNLVDVIGMSGSRYKIKIANAYTGYIDKNKITTPDKLTTKYPHGVCTGNDVAVRKGAGKSYDKISGYPTLNKDNEVDILGSKKDSSGNVWKKVRIAGKHIGYVFGKYIKQD
ncbi:MAG: GH25 family lysozyme [Blautia sp.]